MTAKLVRELRRQAHLGARDPLGACDAMFRAADALERAEKERDEAIARGAAGGPYPGPWYHADYYFAQKDRADEAEAERDRLRAENERLDDRVTQTEERLRHEAGEGDRYSVTVRADGDILREGPE